MTEKVNWEEERKYLHDKLLTTFGKSRIVQLDVGGTHKIKTNLDVLTSVPDTLLHRMFSGRHSIPKNEKGNVFIDRDGEAFLAIVNYLRDGRRNIPEFDSIKQKQLFIKELEFWEMKEDLMRFQKEQHIK